LYVLRIAEKTDAKKINQEITPLASEAALAYLLNFELRERRVGRRTQLEYIRQL
jgi:hypothetical protein